MIFLKYKSLFIITLISFFTFGFSVKVRMFSCDDILLRSRYAILNVKNINYDCNFLQKFAGGNDTLKTKAKIAMEIKSKDSLLGCDLKISSQFLFYSISLKSELFYNGKKNISLNHTKKKATIDTIGIRGRAKPTLNLLNQNFPTANLMNHYTEKLPYEPFFKSSTKISMGEEEKVGIYTCYKLEIVALDPDRKKRTTTLYIDKKSFLPVRRIDAVGSANKFQYSDFVLSAVKINDPQTLRLLKEPLIPKAYEIDYYRLDRY